MDFETPLETICRLIVRAREWDAQVPSNEDHEPGDDEPVSDDDEYDVMIDEKNEAVEAEVNALLDDLGEDQLAEILALAWIGNGTYEAEEWDDAIEAATDSDTDAMIDQLMDMPMLAAYLQSGLEAFDLSCEGIGQID